MPIKRDYMVMGCEGSFIWEVGGAIPKEFKSEQAALKAAKEHLKTSQYDEVWVYRLSHVVSKPEPFEPDVEEVP